VLGRASRLRSVAAVSGERSINVLEQPPRWYTPFVALTPFRDMLAVAPVGAMGVLLAIQEGYIKQEIRCRCGTGNAGGSLGFSHGSTRNIRGPRALQGPARKQGIPYGDPHNGSVADTKSLISNKPRPLQDLRQSGKVLSQIL
jgi:hypothetical protein